MCPHGFPRNCEQISLRSRWRTERIMMALMNIFVTPKSSSRSRFAPSSGVSTGPRGRIVRFVLQFSRGQLCLPECHGTAADLDQFASEAGRGCGRVQQPGAFCGVQVSSVSRRTLATPEDLSGSVVWVADYDRRVDPVLGQKLPRRRFKFRNRAFAGSDRRALGGSSGRHIDGPARTCTRRVGDPALWRALRIYRRPTANHGA